MSGGQALLSLANTCSASKSSTSSALEVPPSTDTVETLLAASKFGELSSREFLLAVAARLQKDPASNHLQAQIVRRQSVLLRLNAKISDSTHVILGLLHLSQAKNQAYKFDVFKAQVEAQKWQLSGDNPSETEVDVFWDQIYCKGRILRRLGRFEEARRCSIRYMVDSSQTLWSRRTGDRRGL